MSNQQTDMMCELVELYALNGLSEEETAAFEEHLKVCAVCRNQLIELKLVVDLLPIASEPIQVPEGMRERVMGHILGNSPEQVQSELEEAAANTHKPDLTGYGANKERILLADNEQTLTSSEENVTDLSRRVTRKDRADRKARYWSLISLGLSAAVIGLGLYAYQLKGTMNGLNSELAAVNSQLNVVNNELAAVNNELKVVKAPSVAGGMQINKMVTLNPSADNVASKGLASIVIDNKGAHLIVQAEDLPQIQQREAFQVWLMKDNMPVNAGTFSPLNGKGVIYFTYEPKDYDTVAITVEPDANGVQPRGSIVLAGDLKS